MQKYDQIRVQQLYKSYFMPKRVEYERRLKIVVLRSFGQTSKFFSKKFLEFQNFIWGMSKVYRNNHPSVSGSEFWIGHSCFLVYTATDMTCMKKFSNKLILIVKKFQRTSVKRLSSRAFFTLDGLMTFFENVSQTLFVCVTLGLS